MSDPEVRRSVAICVPAEAWGYLVAAGLNYQKTNATRAELVRSALAFVSEALKNGGARGIGPTNWPPPPPPGGGL